MALGVKPSFRNVETVKLAGQTVCTNAAAETNQRNRYTENLRRWARYFQTNISRSVSHLDEILAPLGTGGMGEGYRAAAIRADPTIKLDAFKQ
jgi:hypothetical protein